MTDTGLTGKWILEKMENIEAVYKILGVTKAPPTGSYVMSVDIKQDGNNFTISRFKDNEKLEERLFTIGKETELVDVEIKMKAKITPSLDGKVLVMNMDVVDAGKQAVVRIEAHGDKIVATHAVEGVVGTRYFKRE